MTGRWRLLGSLQSSVPCLVFGLWLTGQHLVTLWLSELLPSIHWGLCCGAVVADGSWESSAEEDRNGDLLWVFPDSFLLAFSLTAASAGPLPSPPVDLPSASIFLSFLLRELYWIDCSSERLEFSCRIQSRMTERLWVWFTEWLRGFADAKQMQSRDCAFV